MLKPLEFSPIILFFATYFMYGFLPATKIFVLATGLALAIQLIFGPKQSFKHYLNQLAVFILGGLTLMTNNPVYIVWAPTIKYLLAATATLMSRLVFRKSLAEEGFKIADLHAPNYAWERLDYGLAVCFLLMAILNLKIYHNYGSEIWTQFKLYSIVGWILLFIPVVLHIESKSHEAQPE